MQGLISKDWNDYWLRQLYDCIRAEEHDYFYGCKVPAGKAPFGLGWGYKISTEPSNWPGIVNESDLAQVNSKGLPLARPSEFIQRPPLIQRSTKLTDEQMFRWFIARGIPKYESFIIHGNPRFNNDPNTFTLDEQTWKALTDYRKIALFSMAYNQGRLGVGGRSCVNRLKTALEKGDWQTASNTIKPAGSGGCGFSMSRGKRNDYLVGRRTREANMILTNTQSDWVTKNKYHLQDKC